MKRNNFNYFKCHIDLTIKGQKRSTFLMENFIKPAYLFKQLPIIDSNIKKSFETS